MKYSLLLLSLLVLAASCSRNAEETLDTPQIHRFMSANRATVKTQISNEMRLRKLSLHLRGTPPSLADFQALNDAANAGTLDSFWAKMSQTYLGSHEHVAKMINRLDELFRMRTTDGLVETRFYVTKTPAKQLPGSETLNAMDTLFENVIRQNLSWDTIATGKSYKVPNPNTGTDFRFLQIATTLPTELSEKEPLSYFDANFDPADARIAGAVTTGRFFGRYSTTNVNKNRGRAAAIFRTFLCDDMKAVVTPSAEEEKELLENGFPLPDLREVMHFTDDDEKKHGSSPDCMNCHYKLDPLGKSFINIGSALPLDPAPGKLTYKRADGSLLELAGSGLGEIMKFVTMQPEYAACQVSHFWKWFIRGDELPNPTRLQELVKEFDRLGRKPNDFIAFLVTQPEFLKTPESLNPSVTMLQVSPLLQHCDNCHAGSVTSKSPPFTKLPIGGDATTHYRWLSEIVEKLDLVHDGAKRPMPPNTSVWQPSASDLALIKRWIYEGAKGENGVETIDPKIAQENILEKSPVADPAPRMEFRDSYVRYLRTHDIFRHFTNKFPNAKRSDQCLQLTTENRMIVGDASPLNGELSFQSPSPAFIRWYDKCLSQIIVSDVLQTLNEAHTFESYVGAVAAGQLKAANLEKALLAPKEVTWKSVPVATQEEVVNFVINRMLGPNTVSDQPALVKTLNGLLVAKADQNFLDAVQKTYFYLGSSDVFLVY